MEPKLNELRKHCDTTIRIKAFLLIFLLLSLFFVSQSTENVFVLLLVSFFDVAVPQWATRGKSAVEFLLYMFCSGQFL